jgi:hypothetical protein
MVADSPYGGFYDFTASVRNILAYRGVNDFKKGYQPRTNIVKDKKGGFVADSHRSFARWRNHLSYVECTLHGDGVRRTEIQTAELLVPESSAFEVAMAVCKLKRHGSPGNNEIPADLGIAEGGTIRPEVHKLIKFVENKDELTEEWKE